MVPPSSSSVPPLCAPSDGLILILFIVKAHVWPQNTIKSRIIDICVIFPPRFFYNRAVWPFFKGAWSKAPPQDQTDRTSSTIHRITPPIKAFDLQHISYSNFTLSYRHGLSNTRNVRRRLIIWAQALRALQPCLNICCPNRILALLFPAQNYVQAINVIFNHNFHTPYYVSYSL